MKERLQLDGGGFRLGWLFLGWWLLIGIISVTAVVGGAFVVAGTGIGPGAGLMELVPVMGWVFVAPLSLLALIVYPWVAVAFFRWFVSRVRTDTGTGLACDARVAGPVFAAFAGFMVLNTGVLLFHSRILNLFFAYVVNPAITWCFLSWFVRNTTVGGVPMRMEYRMAWAYTWRYLVVVLSVLSVIGWIWAGPWLLRWMAGQVATAYGAFSYALRPGRFFKYVVVTLLYSLGVVTIPWAFVYLNRRLIGGVEITRPQA